MHGLNLTVPGSEIARDGDGCDRAERPFHGGLVFFVKFKTRDQTVEAEKDKALLRKDEVEMVTFLSHFFGRSSDRHIVTRTYGCRSLPLIIDPVAW